MRTATAPAHAAPTTAAQTTPAAPPARALAVPGTPAPGIPSVPAPAGPRHGYTPRRLRRIRAAVLAAIILVCGTTAVVTLADGATIENMVAANAQSIRMRDVASDLSRAQEQAEHHLSDKSDTGETDTLIDNALVGLTQAAAERPADADRLASLSSQIAAYGNELRSATSAKDLDAAQKTLDGLSAALSSWQVGDADTDSLTWSNHLLLLAVANWAVAAGIVAACVAVARVSHRVLNPGLVVAFACVAATAWADTSLWASRPVTFGPGASGSPFLLLAGLAAAAALVGGVGAAWGLARRLREYR